MIPQPLRILCIGDGRPGHEKQTLAMVEAFGRMAEVESCWFRVPEGRAFAFFSRFQEGYTRIFPFQRRGLLRKWGWEAEDFYPHLIMAAGSHTHGALLLFARHFGARSLVCMTPDLWVRHHVDLVLSPLHDGRVSGGNVLGTLGPPCRQGLGGERRKELGLILVGGLDASSHVWDSDRLLVQIRSLLESGRRAFWEISSSPRTPKETEAALKTLVTAFPHASFFPFSETAPGWVEAAYARSAEAWISADSMSMVYEALSAGCRVGVLPVNWKRPGNKFEKSLELLHREGWIFYPGEEGTEKKVLLDEAGRAAREAVQRWWRER